VGHLLMKLDTIPTVSETGAPSSGTDILDFPKLQWSSSWPSHDIHGKGKCDVHYSSFRTSNISCRMFSACRGCIVQLRQVQGISIVVSLYITSCFECRHSHRRLISCLELGQYSRQKSLFLQCRMLFELSLPIDQLLSESDIQGLVTRPCYST
jgi:hypothetical protein